MPYWVASALCKAAAIGMDVVAAEPARYDRTDEEFERMRLGVVALGRQMKAVREGYQ